MADVKTYMLSQAEKAGISMTEAQAEQFAAYHALLIDANSRFNLTRVPDDVEEACDRNYFDSIAAIGEFSGVGSLIDVGSGAGLPGIPLAIMLPDTKVTLLETLKKRADFLTDTAEKLGLVNVRVVNMRAEDAGKAALREQFDVATARAVAALNILSEYLLPMVKVGGRMLALKGPQAEEELSAAGNALSKLGGEPGRVVACPVPGRDWEHKLVAVKKTSATPAAYPRRSGMPEKKPL